MPERIVARAELTDDRGSAVKVEERGVTGLPRVWVFCKDAGGKDCPPYLDAGMAAVVRDGLEAFIAAHGTEEKPAMAGDYRFPHEPPCRCPECNAVLMRYMADHAGEIRELMERDRAPLTVASVDPGDAEAFGMALDQVAEEEARDA